MNEPATFVFAPEVEQALVAACFQVPSRIAIVYRELDPSVHFTDPNLRHILAATDLAYRELGSTDFASLIQVLREEGQLAECGGLEGVNSVLEQYRYGFSSPEAAEEIIEHYIEMLKAYALGRENNGHVYRFNRGDIKLVPNKNKHSDSAPDFIGEGKIAGRIYRAAVWKNAEGLAISLIPK